MTATHLLYQAAGSPAISGDTTGTCRVCGQPGIGLPFTAWVKETFNDWDKLQPGDIICHACLFCMDDHRIDLAGIVGKEKPQRMRNYSHFVVDGHWVPLSKADKIRMRDILLVGPDLAIIAVSGQKHIIFRATPGWWQIEEQSSLPFLRSLQATLVLVEELYNGGFSKTEIESGHYSQARIIAFGLARWHELEIQVVPWRGTLPLQLALFLAQKEDADGGKIPTGGTTADSGVEGYPPGLQEPVQAQHLATVSGQRTVSRLHQQPEPVLQLGLFAAGGGDPDG